MPDLDYERIAALVNAFGVPCYVEQTGGGCATIYAGTPVPVCTVCDELEGQCDTSPPRLGDPGGEHTFSPSHETRHPVAAGPGGFRGPGFTNPWGHTDEFYVGPNDHGQAGAYSATDRDTEASLAGRIVALAAQLPVSPPPALRDRTLPRCPNCGYVNWKVDTDIVHRVAVSLSNLGDIVYFDRVGSTDTELRDGGNVACMACAYELRDEDNDEDAAAFGTIYAAAAATVVRSDATEWRILNDYREF